MIKTPSLSSTETNVSVFSQNCSAIFFFIFVRDFVIKTRAFKLFCGRGGGGPNKSKRVFYFWYVHLCHAPRFYLNRGGFE